MGSNVLTFVIVGHDDHPIFESDLAPRPDGREVLQTVEHTVCQEYFPETFCRLALRHKECTCTNLFYMLP